jgi:hypothetical protein
MEKSRERSLARKIVRRVATNMKPFGYTLTKTTFLGKEYHIRRRKHGSKAIRPVLKTVNVCLQAGTP